MTDRFRVHVQPAQHGGRVGVYVRNKFFVQAAFVRGDRYHLFVIEGYAQAFGDDLTYALAARPVLARYRYNHARTVGALCVGRRRKFERLRE